MKLRSSRVGAYAHFLDTLAHPGESALGQILVSVIAHEQDDALFELLGVFEAGIMVEDIPYPVRFNVAGAMSSAVLGVSASAFVVNAVHDEELLECAVSPEALRAGLEAEILRVWARESTDRSVQAWVLPPTRDGLLFSAKSYHEFRFGVLPRDGQDASERLSSIAKALSATLGREGVPIAFMRFPTLWRSSTDGPLSGLAPGVAQLAWLKVAVGLPHDLAAPIELQLAAHALAKQHNAVLCLYNPASEAPAMGDRFSAAHVPADVRALPFTDVVRSSVTSGNDALTAADRASVDVAYVIVEAKARSGLVADMFRSYPPAVGSGPVGGTMSVMDGHTVAMWAVPRPAGDAFASSLRKMLRIPQNVEPPEATRVAVYNTAEGFGSWGDRLHAEDSSFWIAWRCPEAPGSIRRVLETVMKELSRGQSGDALLDLTNQFERLSDWRVSVNYLIGRVLADGATCAGKLKLEMPKEVAERLAQRSEALVKELTARLYRPQEPGWDPEHSEWRDHPVLVGVGEPAEEPWASLTLGEG